MFTRLIVPLDGSDLAERALPQAQELARLTGAPLHLVRVIDLGRLERYGSYGLALEYGAVEKIVEEEEESARAYMQSVVERLKAEDVAVTSEIRRGLAGRELIAVAEPSDLIVMASHGRGGIARWFLGSVAEEVTRRSRAPVLLVRALAPADHASAPGGSMA
jgi:nucleotide-binding universal stress UspA family protein